DPASARVSRGASERASALHPDLLILAQPGGVVVRQDRARRDRPRHLHLRLRSEEKAHALHPSVQQGPANSEVEVRRSKQTSRYRFSCYRPLVTRSTRQASLHHFPRNALHGAGIELLGAALDLSAPGLLDTFLNLDVEALNQRANQIGAILLRQRQCLAKDFVSRCRHGQSLLLRQTKRYVPP